MSFSLTAADQGILLRTARSSIGERWAEAGERAGASPAEAAAGGSGGSAALGERCGAFVTIHLGRSLRGCIGRMSSPEPLIDAIREMAKESAFGDPRFPPLSRDELPRCTLEISVLSPMVPCGDLETIEVGVHGVYLAKGGRAGVFLPQVPVEQGWDRKQYLNQLCLKAGLQPGAHLESDAKVYTFTATVFSERS